MFEFGATGVFGITKKDCSPQLVLLLQAKVSIAENSNIFSENFEEKKNIVSILRTQE